MLNRLSSSSHKFYGTHLIKSTLQNGIDQETNTHLRGTHGLNSTSISFQIDFFSLWRMLKVTDLGQSTIAYRFGLNKLGGGR